jgi:hypothetical protein
MHMKKVYNLLLAGLILVSFNSMGQGYWSDAPHPIRTNQVIKPAEYRSLSLDFHAMQTLLGSAPSEQEVDVRFSEAMIAIPMPDGTTQTFRFVESSIMEPELQAQFPQIRSYSGMSVDDPTARIRFSISHMSFNAMIMSSKGTVYIDPLSLTDDSYYMAYTREAFYSNTDKNANGRACEIPDQIDTEKYDERIEKPLTSKKKVQTMGYRGPNGTQLRTYRLALACTGEYAAFFGGTVPNVVAAMNNSMTRVNGIYEQEVAIRMVLVANNANLIYLNAGTDPYTNNNGGTMLGQNITTCNSVIGSANYDIGHVFSTGGGGVAYLGVPCTTNKAGGVTGSGSPVGDPFDVDYVAHEMGHQFGGNHTQNNSCNRSTNAAYEPGSASTIMGYAGICTPNLQSNSDPYFHNHSYNEIRVFSTTGNGNTCPVTTNTGNTPPTVDAGVGGWTIPISTPFELTAVASDANGDPITYNWEQYDLGPATATGDNNLTNPSGNQPIFRSWNATDSPTRVFPRIQNLVNNTTVVGEHLPTYSRNLSFRCTVRDNRIAGGGVNDDQVTFAVSSTAGPFVVTAPNTAVTYPGNTLQTVTWNVANTTAAPISAANVDIFLSLDGGFTWPITLVSNTPNDGSQAVLIPAGQTTQARVKVKASGNIFFDISNTNFTIGPAIGNNNWDAGIASIAGATGDFCGGSITPEVGIFNGGTQTITSFTLTYNIDGGTNGTFNWTGSIATGQTANVVLPTLTASSGAHVFNVTVSNPNGNTDQNNLNDSGSSNFTTISGATVATFTILTDCWGEEVSWNLTSSSGTVIASVTTNTYADQATISQDFCLASGCYDFNIFDSFGDGLAGIPSGCAINGDYNITDSFGNVLVQMGVPNYGSGTSHNFCVPVGTPGCTDISACNYDAAATVDDGSCDFSCFGCTNAAACNYSPVATIDDGSCILPNGCTNAAACNFNPAATCDDGSCILPNGCTNAAACNFNPAATCDDGSCILPNGCTNAAACNFNPAATCDDGSCILPNGCTNAAACNFNPAATCDDGSCILPNGCTDNTACNYNAAATCDDGSCTYAVTYFADSDGDGFGDASTSAQLCAPQTGFVLDNTDCDDTRNDVYPGAPGTAQGIDNNCNGTIDPAEVAVCLGDFNNDGQINIADLLVLLGDFGCNTSCSADLNGDNVVNSSDALLFFGLFGTSCN